MERDCSDHVICVNIWNNHIMILKYICMVLSILIIFLFKHFIEIQNHVKIPQLSVPINELFVLTLKTKVILTSTSAGFLYKLSMHLTLSYVARYHPYNIFKQRITLRYLVNLV